MSFFKSKAEKEIIAQMERDEQMQIFNEQILELKKKREEYIKIAAEAEINGDSGSYDVAVNALVELNDIISSLTQTKANFDIINVSNAIAVNMAMAMNAIEKMAGGKTQMPDIKKIQKANVKISKYMRSIKISQKAMSGAMKNSNPANKQRSQAELQSVRPLIDAEISRMIGSSTANLPSSKQSTQTSGGDSVFDLANEIQAEKNRII